MAKYDLLVSSKDCTMISQYIPNKDNDTTYESEALLENKFIQTLQGQSYEYLKIHTEEDLIKNLRAQLETLNNYTFSDNEWTHFFRNKLSNASEGIVQKTRKIQEDYIQILEMDSGESKNIKLIDKTNIHQNKLQVINQFEESKGTHNSRYDVTILVNGLPLVHVELKRRGVSVKEAFNQINRYQYESFWGGSGLFEYVQVFIISNGTITKYYSNTTRFNNVKKSTNSSNEKHNKGLNSYEFTSYWSDIKNNKILDLMDFTKTFLSKHTILNVLTKYCVFTSDNSLMVLRPYQIAAIEKMVNKVEISLNYQKEGSIDAGGFIWHSTGSGKTLTSFKAAQLITHMEGIDKVLFVVDRKDLDYQTMREYDKFEKGAANSNTTTRILEKQLSDPNTHIVITTMQKLSRFIERNPSHSLANQKIVIIFDECHRSQFGDMHKAIRKYFKKYFMFGFTGTPIFSKNTSSTGIGNIQTTTQLFGDCLHTYTIVNAIHDGNVLPFRIDYIDTVNKDIKGTDALVQDINKEAALLDERRVSNIVRYIRDHYNQKTYRNKASAKYTHAVITNSEELAKSKKNKVVEQKIKKVLSGFNSLFAVDSIDAAIAYYYEFKKQQEEVEDKLIVATIFTYGKNDDEYLEDDTFLNIDESDIKGSKRECLEEIIKDYNQIFNTNYDTSKDGFQGYYKDVSLRTKNKEIDVLIVVNMFLTGFDAPALNTLWIDKQVQTHGLLQAFSRTNRVLNSVKSYGNIVCFRNLDAEVRESIALFGDSEASGIILLRPYEDYFDGYKEGKEYHQGYKDIILALKTELSMENVIGESKEKEFIICYGNLLKFENLLNCYDRFKEERKLLVTEREIQDWQSFYLDLYEKKKKESILNKEDINDNITFEMELIKQVDVNIDYILKLVEQYHQGNCEDKDTFMSIKKVMNSSPDLRSKKELIENFIHSVNMNEDASFIEAWNEHINNSKEEDLDELIQDEKLDADKVRKILEDASVNGFVKTTGVEIVEAMPRQSRFNKLKISRSENIERVVRKIIDYYDKYKDS